MAQNAETANRSGNSPLKKKTKVWFSVFWISAVLAFLPIILHKEDSALILLLPLGFLAMIISGIVALVMYAKEKKSAKIFPVQPADANKKPVSPTVAMPTPSPTVAMPAVSENQTEGKQAEAPAAPPRAKLSYVPLESIPAVEIKPDESAAKKRLASEVKEISMSNITKRSSRQKLGNFVVIDTETTGLNPVNCDIVEVSAIRFRDFKPVERFSTLCGSKKGIPAEASKVNGITAAMIEGKPLFGQIAGPLQAFIGADNLVGHNLEFDSANCADFKPFFGALYETRMKQGKVFDARISVLTGEIRRLVGLLFGGLDAFCQPAGDRHAQLFEILRN